MAKSQIHTYHNASFNFDFSQYLASNPHSSKLSPQKLNTISMLSPHFVKTISKICTIYPHYLHTIVILFPLYSKLSTLISMMTPHKLHIIWTLFPHYIYTAFTLSSHYLHTISFLFINLHLYAGFIRCTIILLTGKYD